MAITTAAASQQVPTTEYPRLEERILDRDQVGANCVLYGLFKPGRPVTEILRETVRTHAPYTRVPYHQRPDDGMVKFVNNDHCLLGEQVSLPLRTATPRGAAAACRVGKDPHNQELGLCLFEDYLHTRASGRDRLLPASAKHTGGRREYGDPLESHRRFAEALDLAGC